MASHYASRMGWGRFVSIMVVVSIVAAVLVALYFFKKIKSNSYFNTVIPTVSADTIDGTSTVAY